MRKVMLLIVVGLLMLSGCSKPDFTMNDLETALLRGECVDGKTVEITVKSVEFNPVLGYMVHAGQSMYFVNQEYPDVSPGDTMVVEIISYVDIYSEFTIPYERVK